jgi:hypothetical protein
MLLGLGRRTCWVSEPQHSWQSSNPVGVCRGEVLLSRVMQGGMVEVGGLFS